MSYDTQGATLGNAAKIAAQLVGVALSTGTDINQVLGLFLSTNDTVAGALLEAQEKHAQAQSFNPAGAVQQAFPGSVVQQQPAGPEPFPAQAVPQQQPQIVAPGQQPAQANVVPFPGGQGPAPLPNAGPAGGVDPEAEQAWTQFFADIDSGQFAAQWDDKRQDKANNPAKLGKIPDFVHKSWQRPGDRYNVGLYVSDKKMPEWVRGRLQQLGVATS